VLCAAVIGVVLLSNKSSALLSVRERVFFIEERLLLKSPSVKIDDVQIWIPIPSNDEWQTVGGLNLKSPLAANFLTEKKYGNKILYLRSKQNAKARRPQEIAVSYKIQRKERGASEETPQYRKDLSRYLKPDKTVPIDGQIQELAVKSMIILSITIAMHETIQKYAVLEIACSPYTIRKECAQIGILYSFL